MAKLLLEQGATINAFDKKDRRAVHWAAYMGHTELVRLLVEHGAELNCRDKQVTDLPPLVVTLYCGDKQLTLTYLPL
jgi:ankyrin repeat protein